MCFEAYMGYVFTIALNYLRHPDYKEKRFIWLRIFKVQNPVSGIWERIHWHIYIYAIIEK